MADNTNKMYLDTYILMQNDTQVPNRNGSENFKNIYATGYIFNAFASQQQGPVFGYRKNPMN